MRGAPFSLDAPSAARSRQSTPASGSDRDYGATAIPAMVPVVMTAHEVASLLRVSPKTVYKYKDCDGLPFRQFGGAVRFYQHEVLDWMDNPPGSRSAT
jgi:excisionase family DNA binding protein